MRTIKFRGKTKDGIWAYGHLADTCYGLVILDEPLFHVDGYEWNIHETEVIPETVGQFTGLLDKNGKEIYDGDVMLFPEFLDGDLKTESFLAPVAFDDGMFYLQDPVDNWFFPLNKSTIDDFELKLVGNIHQP